MKKLLLSFALSAFALSTSSSNGETVYICTGPKAEAYHSKSKCRGLNRCSGDVKKGYAGQSRTNGQARL